MGLPVGEPRDSSFEAPDADVPRMGDEIREGVFAHAAVAFVQRDLETLLRLVGDDVELILGGSSPLAGAHRGPEAVSRVVMQLRRYVSCSAEPIRFSHGWDRMAAHRDVMIIGLRHRVGMTVHLTFSFDRSDRIRTLVIEPSDPGLFDHVVTTELTEHDPNPVRIPELIRDRQPAGTAEEGQRATIGRGRRHL
jgi:ketosteroid isomerase-like protein